MLQKLALLTKEEFQEGQILLLNKEIGWTSFDIVKKIKNLLKEKFKIKKIKVGHAGTLDPLASGLLIICTGKSTKIISSIQDQKKTYTGEITLGASTPSFDLETEINKTYNVSNITNKNIKEVSKTFLGEINQKPPLFSAIKIKGERLYKKARRGEIVEIKSRKVTVCSFDINTIDMPKFTFQISCSKGTYIRSIANDFGEKLGNAGHLSCLSRMKIGEYNLKDAITITEFDKKLNM
jgi:tRNA pseudouridine55 synthase